VVDHAADTVTERLNEGISPHLAGHLHLGANVENWPTPARWPSPAPAMRSTTPSPVATRQQIDGGAGNDSLTGGDGNDS
jgi:Ca2+-binding RTX toxin-like protein